MHVCVFKIRLSTAALYLSADGSTFDRTGNHDSGEECEVLMIMRMVQLVDDKDKQTQWRNYNFWAPPTNIRYGLTVFIHNSGHFGLPLLTDASESPTHVQAVGAGRG